MDKRTNMDICNDFASLSHLDCSKCLSTDVTPTGNFSYDNRGFYIDVKCNNCDEVTQCGDGEFQVEVAKFVDGQFISVEESIDHIVVYNLDFVEFILLKTTLPRSTIIKKAKEFRKNGGRYESDFITQLEEEYGPGVVEQNPVDAVDFDNLDIYGEDE